MTLTLCNGKQSLFGKGHPLKTKEDAMLIETRMV